MNATPYGSYRVEVVRGAMSDITVWVARALQS